MKEKKEGKKERKKERKKEVASLEGIGGVYWNEVAPQLGT